MKRNNLLLIAAIVFASCANQKKELSIITPFGVVKAINTTDINHQPGDTVFIKQLLEGAGKKWEVLPSMDYQEGYNKERYLFSRADRTGTDTFYIGIQYRIGVVK